MSDNRRELVLRATEKALAVRQQAGYGLLEPINVYDLAERLDMEVRFVSMGSLEGMYHKGTPPRIFVSSLRPPGRQVFTCGHEVGHVVFKHGSRIDELMNQARQAGQWNPEEFLVDCFSGLLLMPKTAVGKAFVTRGWNVEGCTPVQMYTLAKWFGVGYGTLIQHMHYTLHMLAKTQADRLLRVTPKQLRLEVLGRNVDGDVVVVDQHWSDRAVDIQVGDVIQLPNAVEAEGQCVRLLDEDAAGSLVCAVAPGRGRLLHSATGWAAWVRVARRNYEGRSIFRHLEDPDDDEARVD